MSLYSFLKAPRKYFLNAEQELEAYLIGEKVCDLIIPQVEELMKLNPVINTLIIDKETQMLQEVKDMILLVIKSRVNRMVNL